jgi:hypothetical protein
MSQLVLEHYGYLWLSIECTPWLSLTIEQCPCGCTKCFVYPSLPPTQVGECHIWAYTELISLQKCPHWWETASSDIGIWERWKTFYLCISSIKGVVLLLSSTYTECDVPSLQCFHVSQLKKTSESTAELSSTEWSHWSQIALSTTSNRVIDRRDHIVRHKMIRPYKLHRRLRGSSFQSPRLHILPVKVFIIFVHIALVAPLLSKSQDEISFNGEGCNTLCYRNLKSLL